MGANFQDLTAFVLSVVGDVPVDSEAPTVTSSISRICRLSLSEVLIGVGLRACIHRNECACVFVSVCVCTVFLKKKKATTRKIKFLRQHFLDKMTIGPLIPDLY